MQTFLSHWISNSPRSPSPYSFGVNDIQKAAPDSSIPVAGLADLLRDSYFDKVYLQGLAEKYGWQKVSEKILSSSIPTSIQVQRGDFAEAITSQWLQECEEFEVPVNKLRFKVRGNDTLHGTDCLAFKVSASGALAEVCYVESKLRTNASTNLAVEGYEQLEVDINEAQPVILSFVGRQLHEKNHHLNQAFQDYMFARDAQIETYKLWICYEEDRWNELVLQNLEDHGVTMARFEVYVHLIGHLADVSNDTFTLIGAYLERCTAILRRPRGWRVLLETSPT